LQLLYVQFDEQAILQVLSMKLNSHITKLVYQILF